MEFNNFLFHYEISRYFIMHFVWFSLSCHDILHDRYLTRLFQCFFACSIGGERMLKCVCFFFVFFFLCGIIDNVLLTCIFFAFALLELLSKVCWLSLQFNRNVVEAYYFSITAQVFFFMIFGNYIKFGFVRVRWWIRWHFFHIKVMHCYYFVIVVFLGSSYNVTCLQYFLLFYFESQHTCVLQFLHSISLFSLRNDEIVENFRGFTATYLKLSHYSFFFVFFLGG